MKSLVDHCKVSKMTNGSLLLSNVQQIARMLFVLFAVKLERESRSV